MGNVLVQQFAPTSFGTWPTNASATLTAMVVTAGTAVCTTSAAFGSVAVGDLVYISGCSTSTYNGFFVVTAIHQGSAPYTFTFVVGSATVTPATAGTAIDLTAPSSDSLTGGSNWGTIGGGNGTNANSQTSIVNRRYGPQFGDSKGWSLDMRQQPSGTGNGNSSWIMFPCSSGQVATIGFASAFFYINSIAANGNSSGTNPAPLILLEDADYGGNGLAGNIITGLYADSGGLLYTNRAAAGVTASAVSTPMNQWFEARIYWDNLGSGKFNSIVQIRAAGTTATNTNNWTTVLNDSSQAQQPFGEGISRVFFGADTNTPNSSQLFIGRMGSPTLYSMTSYPTLGGGGTTVPSIGTDPIYPSNIAGGQTFARANFYQDPYLGSDTNDGSSSTAAWQTMNMLNTEASFGGFFNANVAAVQAIEGVVSTTSGTTYTPTGDICQFNAAEQLIGGFAYDWQYGNVIPGNGTELNLAPTQLDEFMNLAGGVTFSQNGIYVHPTGWVGPPYNGALQPTVRMHNLKTIASGTWTADGSGGYHTSDSGSGNSNGLPVVFENGILLQPVTSLATCDSTAGTSYVSYSSGTTLTIHPFNSTNPTSDGNVYQRTNPSAGGNNVFVLSGTNSFVAGIGIYGTGTVAGGASGSTVNGSGYCFQFGVTGQTGGMMVADSCFFSLGGTHNAGRAASGSNANNNNYELWFNCVSGPMIDGSGSCWVSNEGVSASTGNQAALVGCSVLGGTSVAPSSGSDVISGPGSATLYQSAAYHFVHQQTNGNYSKVFFVDNDMVQSNGLTSVNVPIKIVGGQYNGLMGVGVASYPITFYGATITNLSFGTSGSGLGGTFTNCILPYTGSSQTTIPTTGVGGTFNHCTFDYGRATVPPLKTSGGSTLTVTSCLILPGASGEDFVTNIASTDTVKLTGNEYGIGSGTYIDSIAAGNMTIAQAGTNGFDVGSQYQATPAVLANYIPTAQSNPTGSSGIFPDWWNTNLFTARQTAGAIEFINQTTGNGGSNVAQNFSGSTSVPSGSTYTIGADMVMATNNKQMTVKITAPAGVAVNFQLMGKPEATGDTPILLADGSIFSASGNVSGGSTYPIPGGTTAVFNLTVPSPFYAYELQFLTNSGTTQTIAWEVTI
jgi:hypothetical protein